MTKKKGGEFPFGKFLKELREKKEVTLKQVEEGTGLSNAYISQLETGTRRRLPSPEKLKALAAYFNVPIKELLEKAGYIDPAEIEETFEEKIEKAFDHVTSDPRFKFGTRVRGGYDLDAKRFIIEMYEKVTGRTILCTEPQQRKDE
jgi:transcriptional regulator with XRE-family HTH domain